MSDFDDGREIVAFEMRRVDPDRWLTTAEAAELLGIGESTLRRWGTSDDPEFAGLKPRRMRARMLRWSRSEVLGWAASR